MELRAWRLGAAVIVALGACSKGPSPPPAQGVFVVPTSLSDLTGVHFFDHPWPSDVRRDASGAVVLGVDDPSENPLIQAYIQSVGSSLTGFSVAAYGYVRFTGDLDPSTLPATPPDTLAASSTVQIVDVDPSSPQRGQRHLAQVYWRPTDGIYWVHDTLSVGPALGYPLLPKTQYAIVVTRGVHDANGNAVEPSSDLREVMGLDTPSARTQPAHDLYAPAVTELGTLGLPASSIAQLAVFTTNDPTAELFALADDVHANVPAPTVDATQWQQMETTTDYDVYQSWYGPSPNYQQGTPPYLSTGGNFVWNATGGPVVQNTFDLRFTLVIPNAATCPPPASGYPVVLYAHGTGGDYRSIVTESGSVGQAAADQCVASVGIDEIFHGARPGAPATGDPNPEGTEEVAFFNFANPDAMRSNTIQSAIDVVQEARLFAETTVTVPASLSRTGQAIAIDPTKVIFFGHSQGSLSGPLYFAADDSARGGVLSGASSSVPITLLEKTSPSPSVAGLWKILLDLTDPTDAAELNLFHPIFSLTQTLVDRIDPLVYMRYLVQSPRAGHAPKSIYQTEGVEADGTGDTYAPPHGIEVGSTAIGLPVQLPDIHARVEAPWGGLPDVAVPAGGLAGNLADGGASGILAQFLPAPGDDGHFVVFHVPECRLQAAEFVKNLADDPKGRVPVLSP